MRRTTLAAVTALAMLGAACSQDASAPVSDEAVVDATATATEVAEPTDEDVASAPAPDTSAQDGASPAPTTDGSASSSPASTPTPSSSTAGASASPTPASGQAASIDPVPAGTYAYATSGTRQLGDNPQEQLPSTTTLQVPAAGGDDVQVQVRDLRDEDGYGSLNSRTLRYGVEGVVLLGSTIESTVDIFGSPFTSTNELEADPPTTIAPLGADVGFRTTFRLVGDDLTIDASLTIVDREAVTIGAEVVDAFVVEVQYALSGSIEGTSNARWWVRPDDLLNLREVVDTDVESRGLRYREQFTAELTSLDPR